MPPGTELEHETLNQYVTTSLSYSPHSVWNLTLRIPYVIRSHSTYAIDNPSQPLLELSRFFSSSLGAGPRVRG